MGKYNDQLRDYLSDVISLHRKGLGSLKISNIVPVPRATIKRWIKKYCGEENKDVASADCKVDTSMVLNDAEKREIHKLMDLGMSQKKIAEYLSKDMACIKACIVNFTGDKNQMSMKESELKKQLSSPETALTLDHSAVDSHVEGTGVPPVPSTTELESMTMEEMAAELLKVRKQLKREKMRADVNEKIIDLAELKYGLKLRKNSDTK